MGLDGASGVFYKYFISPSDLVEKLRALSTDEFSIDDDLIVGVDTSIIFHQAFRKLLQGENEIVSAEMVGVCAAKRVLELCQILSSPDSDDNTVHIIGTHDAAERHHSKSRSLRRRMEREDLTNKHRIYHAKLNELGSPDDLDTRQQRRQLSRKARSTYIKSLPLPNGIVGYFDSAMRSSLGEKYTSVVAPFQADTQLAVQLMEGLIHLIYSSDGDILMHLDDKRAFSLAKIDRDNEKALRCHIRSLFPLPWLADKPSIEAKHKMFYPDQPPLLRYLLGVATGCDVLPGGLRGVGPATLAKLVLHGVTEDSLMAKLLQRKSAPPRYVLKDAVAAYALEPARAIDGRLRRARVGESAAHTSYTAAFWIPGDTFVDEHGITIPGKDYTDESGDLLKFCICGSHLEFGFMISCDECKAWYHGSCIGVTDTKELRDAPFTCPMCDSHKCTLQEDDPQSDCSSSIDAITPLAATPVPESNYVCCAGLYAGLAHLVHRHFIRKPCPRCNKIRCQYCAPVGVCVFCARIDTVPGVNDALEMVNVGDNDAASRLISAYTPDISDAPIDSLTSAQVYSALRQLKVEGISNCTDDERREHLRGVLSGKYPGFAGSAKTVEEQKAAVRALVEDGSISALSVSWAYDWGPAPGSTKPLSQFLTNADSREMLMLLSLFGNLAARCPREDSRFNINGLFGNYVLNSVDRHREFGGKQRALRRALRGAYGEYVDPLSSSVAAVVERNEHKLLYLRTSFRASYKTLSRYDLELWMGEDGLVHAHGSCRLGIACHHAFGILVFIECELLKASTGLADYILERFVDMNGDDGTIRNEIGHVRQLYKIGHSYVDDEAMLRSLKAGTSERNKWKTLRGETTNSIVKLSVGYLTDYHIESPGASVSKERDGSAPVLDEGPHLEPYNAFPPGFDPDIFDYLHTYIAFAKADEKTLREFAETEKGARKRGKKKPPMLLMESILGRLVGLRANNARAVASAREDRRVGSRTRSKRRSSSSPPAVQKQKQKRVPVGTAAVNGVRRKKRERPRRQRAHDYCAFRGCEHTDLSCILRSIPSLSTAKCEDLRKKRNVIRSGELRKLGIDTNYEGNVRVCKCHTRLEDGLLDPTGPKSSMSPARQPSKGVGEARLKDHYLRKVDESAGVHSVERALYDTFENKDQAYAELLAENTLLSAELDAARKTRTPIRFDNVSTDELRRNTRFTSKASLRAYVVDFLFNGDEDALNNVRRFNWRDGKLDAYDNRVYDKRGRTNQLTMLDYFLAYFWRSYAKENSYPHIAISMGVSESTIKRAETTCAVIEARRRVAFGRPSLLEFKWLGCMTRYSRYRARQVDGTDIVVRGAPSDARLYKLFFSRYYNGVCIKVLIYNDISGGWIEVSRLCPGLISDNKQFRLCRLAEKEEEAYLHDVDNIAELKVLGLVEDDVCAVRTLWETDKGFRLALHLSQFGQALRTPTFGMEGAQFSPLEAINTLKVAFDRNESERAVRRLCLFGLLSNGVAIHADFKVYEMGVQNAGFRSNVLFRPLTKVKKTAS